MTNEEIREHALALIDYCDGKPVEARCGDDREWINVPKFVPYPNSYSQLLRRKPTREKRLMKWTEFPAQFWIQNKNNRQWWLNVQAIGSAYIKADDRQFSYADLAESFEWSEDRKTAKSFYIESEVA